MERGTYTLLVALEVPTEIEFGAAGRRELEAGWYAYTGSAFGPGGLKRVDRHRRVADGRNETRHWHVDYLLGARDTTLEGVWTGPGLDAECDVAKSLPGEPIQGIGATDCSCPSHLTYSSSKATLVEEIDAAYS